MKEAETIIEASARITFDSTGSTRKLFRKAVSTSNMFQWLADEIARVRTRKFYLVDGPASAELREAVDDSGVPIPPSYKEFIFRFGNAKLYRSLDLYLVEVYAAPREAASDETGPMLCFGKEDRVAVYFKKADLKPGTEAPVYKWRSETGLRRHAVGFEEWLRAACASARKQFRRKEWEAIERGPAPFSESEQAIVRARRLYRWRIVGIAPNGNLRFEVHNGSTMMLPYLSVGIRGQLWPPKTGPLLGGVWLPVSAIPPGETAVVEFNCYRDLVDPKTVEAFDKPDPGPEDRDRYWEFKALH